jgi:outer membrane protein
MRSLLLLVALSISSVSWAGGLAVVDFERARNETNEGKAAQKNMDTMYASRKSEIETLQVQLETAVKDYQARQMILSEEAKQTTERDLMQRQQQFEATYQQYQSEMQQNYYGMLQELDTKMRALTEIIAKEKAFDVVFDKGAVVYVGGSAVDLTDVLIQRYNAL